MKSFFWAVKGAKWYYGRTFGILLISTQELQTFCMEFLFWGLNFIILPCCCHEHRHLESGYNCRSLLIRAFTKIGTVSKTRRWAKTGWFQRGYRQKRIIESGKIGLVNEGTECVLHKSWTEASMLLNGANSEHKLNDGNVGVQVVSGSLSPRRVRICRLSTSQIRLVRKYSSDSNSQLYINTHSKTLADNSKGCELCSI